MGATWRGWMQSLAPKPWRRDHARSASRRCFVVELRRDTGHGRRQARDARCHREHAGGIGQAVGAVGNVQIEVERVVERAEDQAGDAGGAGDVRARSQRRDALSISAQHARVGNCRPHGAHLRRRLGLGQHHAGDARLAQQAQVVGEAGGVRRR